MLFLEMQLCTVPNPQPFLQRKRIYIDISTGERKPKLYIKRNSQAHTHVLLKWHGWLSLHWAVQWGPCLDFQCLVLSKCPGASPHQECAVRGKKLQEQILSAVLWAVCAVSCQIWRCVPKDKIKTLYIILVDWGLMLSFRPSVRIGSHQITFP